jgi:P4 family phage/plasmid primase-like protien
MEETIKKILKSTYVDGVFHTHVSLIKPRGKFQFNRQILEEFWTAYCDFIENYGFETKEEVCFGIAEKPQQYLPVLVDVDLRIKDNENWVGESLYTDEQVKNVVEVYQSILRKILEDPKDEDLTCVLLEKNMYYQTKNDIGYLKHGFHLHFPYCFLNKIDQEMHLIPRVKDTLKSMELFKNLGIEDSGDVIDKVCCKVPWLVYGSRKSEENQPYKITKIFDSSLSEISFEKAFKNYQIFDIREQVINIKGKVKYYLPRILSIIPYSRKTRELRRGIISPLKEKLKVKERQTSSQNHNKLSCEEALSIAKKLLPLIADYRAEDRNEWMTIGWILYNISEGSNEGLELWCDFSSRCEDKYDENVCVYQWERMTKRDISIGTLKYYASVDNPEEYKKFKTEQSDKYIISSLDGSHNDVAKALYEEYSDEFVCASVTNNIWYQFINHKWESIEDGVFLREKISGKIVSRYTEAVKSMYDKMNSSQDKSETMMIGVKIKQLNKMICNLKSATYKSSVMREAKEVFYDPKFKDKLNADPYIIGFKNGVYDLKLNTFRPGRPEDYISKNMPINYTNFTEEDEKVQEVYTFLEQVFPDKSVRKYFMDISSDVFVGGNHEKTVNFWLGEGDNGKSVTQALFEHMLGKLSVKLNTTGLTGKKTSAGNANADFARLGDGVRQVNLEEPDSDEMINAGILKHLSGNDTFFARDLFEKGKETREIKPMFKLNFICNKLPRIRGADKAVWNRVRVIPFESTFCRPDDPAPDTIEEQLKQKRFPMDKQFGKKIPHLVEPLAWILIQHRQKITNRIEPEKVRIATEIYRKQNDIYKQFTDESIIKDNTKFISLVELYNLFKDWFRESLPGHSIPVKNEIEEYFIKLWGIPESGKKWKGYRQRTLQDDLDDGTAIVITETDLQDYST